jgi:ABC-2 type transport system ATP-binding protein
VSLARALVHDPPVLVLDEPAAGLDPRARIELRELLKALADGGKAILISSHILTELSEICDGAVIIEQGRILRAGSMERIVAGETSHCTVVIRTIDAVDSLQKELLQMPSIHDVRLSGGEVEIKIDGGDEIRGEILSQLIGKGFRVVDFHQRQMDLEDVFMTVTKGNVQ